MALVGPTRSDGPTAVAPDVLAASDPAAYLFAPDCHLVASAV